jgi:UDP-galactopyranose mutase
VVRGFCEGLGIDLVGRFSRFEYLNLDGVIRMAMDFAEAAG